ncbi:MAG: ABC transporter permease subunit [Candidatus Sericytochromatia bacterium]|nr:ABC transporter permease subunit [Candidatus Tanganyikabacteria bacterium]
MQKIVDLANNTFRETIRDRVLNAALVFAVAMIGASVLLGTLSIGQDIKIMRDLGLAAIEVFGAAIAIFVGTSMLFREIDKRTVIVVLAKPVTRHEFLLGKFLGLSATLTCLLVAMAAAYAALLLYSGGWDNALLWQVALVWMQLLVLVGLSLMFSAFTSPVLAMLFTFGLYLAGHNLDSFKVLGEKASPLVKALTEALYYGLPNFSHLDIKNQVVYGAPFSLPQFGVAVTYGAVYAALALAVAMVVFSRREL